MNPRATKLAEGFSQKVLDTLYARSITDFITNRDHEGEIVGVGSVLNILTLGELDEKNYSGANLSADDLTESNARLEIDQRKSFYFKVKSIDNFDSFIKNPLPTVEMQRIGKRMKNMDTFVLGKYADVAAGNRVGTDYATGTVTVDVTTGAVTGSGTTFTAAMVGRGFKAVGHTVWYRVKSYASATSIVIENDSDDETSAYDGGAISGGTAYVIEAATKLKVTPANIRQYLGALKIKLDLAEVPDEDRWIVLPTEIADLLTRGSNIALAVPEAYRDLVQKGYLMDVSGFKVFQSVNLSGNNTDGYHVIAGSKLWQTFADKQLEARIEEDLIGNFGAAYKDLFVYGSKVADIRRKFAAEGFWYAAES